MRATIGRGSRGRRGLTLIEVAVVLGIVTVLIGLLLPAALDKRCFSRRAACVYNLKTIALGLWLYETEHAALPPAWTLDAERRPMHGWRTLVLPFIDEQALYRTIDLARPWRDPANLTGGETRVSLFICPESTTPETSTSYLTMSGPSACLVPGKPRRAADVTDGAASTLIVIEAGDDHAVPWIAPCDADESVLLGLATAKLHHPPRGTNAAFLDGSVRFLGADTSPNILRALVTIDGGETVDPDSF